MISKLCITAAMLFVYIYIHKEKVKCNGEGKHHEGINKNSFSGDQLATAATANTADELEFWVRDPKFDTRRDLRNKTNVLANKHKFTLKHETTKKTASTLAISTNNTNTTTRNTTDDPLKHEPNLRAKTEFGSTADSRRGKFHGHFATPKTKKIWGKSIGRQDNPNHKSTRIVPETEPQLSEGKEKWWWFSENNNDTKGDRFSLSPYSIAKQLDQITSKMPEANVTTEILGRTAEYNDIVLIKVTEKKSEMDRYFRADDSKYIDEVPEKKIVFIVHALSVMGMDRMAVFKSNHYYSKLFSYYFAHLDKFDIFLIPMANPDGYAFVMNRAGKVTWNKNLSPQAGCAGVSLDRNFDVGWNISKPISTCSQHFPGTAPFSEPETRAVRNVMHRYSHKIIAYMHLHSGSYDGDSFKGDAILYPKGYSDVQSDDDRYIDLKGEIDESMKNASFKYLSVTVDTLHNWYGKVFGTSVDYASTVYGIPYAMELVMQVFVNPKPVDTEEDLENIALEQIWARIIDVIFKSIWKNMHSNDLQ